MPCLSCGGKEGGCDACDHRDKATVRECPRSAISAVTHEVVDLIALAERGPWPLGGGSLHETQSFTDAYRFYLNTRERLRAKAK